uniref:Zinc finger protein 26 n=1 Tax=Cacopsylla melanoneura TaxID=428564 RepID=A0A8D8S965_9HEMI
MLLDLRLISQSYQLFVSIRQKKTKEQLKEQKMDEFVITNVMTRRVSERIKERESFLILVEEYSSSDTDNEVEDTKPSSPKPKRVHSFRRNTRKKKQNSSMQSSDEDDVLLGRLNRWCRNKENTYSKNFVQMCPNNPGQIDTGPSTCYICQHTFNNLNDLFFHGINHITQIDSKYKCNVCGAMFKNDVCHVRPHIMKHNYVRVKCDICSRTFNSTSYLGTHIKQEHGGVRYKCPECGKCYTQKVNLKQHIESHKGNYFICYHCDKKFTHRALLVRHVQIHMQTKKYTCHVCGRTLSFLKSYEIHMKCHQGLSVNKCSTCSKNFTTKYLLSEHISKAHEPSKEYKCPLCKRTYKTKPLLDLHILRHSGEGGFECEICKKQYATQKYLEEHLLLHKGHSYQCNICDKTYTHLANLKRHCKLHDGKKFICAVCDRSFSARDMLQSHMITHNEQRETKSCKLCNVVVMRSSYSLHCKTVKHCQNLKESRRKSRKKITISRET